ALVERVAGGSSCRFGFGDRPFFALVLGSFGRDLYGASQVYRLVRRPLSVLGRSLAPGLRRVIAGHFGVVWGRNSLWVECHRLGWFVLFWRSPTIGRLDLRRGWLLQGHTPLSRRFKT